MARKRRWLLRLLLFVAALAIAAFFLAPLLPLDSFKPQVESRLSATLGRKVSVGSMRLTLWGGPFITIKGMTAKEDPAFGSGDFMKADQVRANFSLKDYLLHRQIVIDRITIDSPELNFIKNGDGVWNWATLGTTPGAPTAFLRSVVRLLAGVGDGFNSIEIEGATIRVTDKTGKQPDSLYKKIALKLSLTKVKDAAKQSQATGEVRAESEEGDGVEKLKAVMPFDFVIDRSNGPGYSAKGVFGPGPLETKNLTAQNFKLDGQFITEPSSEMSGSGHISANEIFIPSLNVSQQVAGAARVNQIGDMNQGTKIGGLETDFNFDHDLVKTTNLRVQQLDGLGDAVAAQGWFRVEAALMLSYAATVELSSDATQQLKSSANPLIGAAVAVLQINNRINVPLTITGDVRNPNIQVDVLRALAQ
ncbi:MAG: AsmA family protein [Blastocatellia bacterium]